ncbi:NAD(P)H-dependent glycerol-3-phosphate dehydrogenase [Snodgrassella sp. CFCC 13594]|uniref:NAD(P)H-dependent glycerol-3-phosphate dehydrogenase n=1 Tax=Snodgrassella sp. CFCC 13594 TaxID=1775559 RepID=UPI0008339E0E|nr:NAD(P)H-dependent glycerol-3-phosphate dehydrogenase [Snodgrassella sp. CFCC 13594]
MKICVMGAGAWGSALAIHFSLHGHVVSLWTHNAEHAQALSQDGENQRYLPGFSFPPTLRIDTQLNDAELVIIATPVAALRQSAERLQAAGLGEVPVLAACKGFEQKSGLLPHQVLTEVLRQNVSVGVLSGPSFAQELAQQLPCAVTLASDHLAWIKTMAQTLNTSVMRLYANHDVVGAAVGGAVKNVLAIATGIADGLHCGLNARAALMTRGLAEITRLATALGGDVTTMMGLAGMGDLILTCTGALSRNRQVGLMLAEGKNLQQILNELGHVAEGVYTVNEAHQLAQHLGVEMPITEILFQLIHDNIAVAEVADALMERAPKVEW